MIDQDTEQQIVNLLSKVNRDRFVGSILKGGLPQLSSRDALPTATADFAYRIIVLRGTPDIAYICLRDAGGTWGWRSAATG